MRSAFTWRRLGETMAAVLVGAAALGAAPGWAAAQAGPGTKGHRAAGPLVLADQGSFFVGGRTQATAANSDITVEQMYVQYQIPQGAGKHVPVVMLHGCCLSGKTYETTPDGRMGWAEYLVRQKHPVYIPDQVSRARSGFDATVSNQVRSGVLPPSQLPSILQASHQTAWTLFRFGPTYGAAFRDGKFPVKAAEELYKQMIPDVNSQLPNPNPTWTNLGLLAKQLGGAVLMGHSQSGFFPEQAALINPDGIRGMITIETGFCTTTLRPDQIAVLAKIPTLMIFGDHLADVPAYAALWTNSYNDCKRVVDQINAAGGDATMMYLPAMGIYGNSHMLMQDRNSLELADLVLAWIRLHVRPSV